MEQARRVDQPEVELDLDGILNNSVTARIMSRDGVKAEDVRALVAEVARKRRLSAPDPGGRAIPAAGGTGWPDRRI